MRQIVTHEMLHAILGIHTEPCRSESSDKEET